MTVATLQKDPGVQTKRGLLVTLRNLVTEVLVMSRRQQKRRAASAARHEISRDVIDRGADFESSLDRARFLNNAAVALDGPGTEPCSEEGSNDVISRSDAILPSPEKDQAQGLENQATSPNIAPLHPELRSSLSTQ